MTKKILAVVMIGVFMLGLVGCGSGQKTAGGEKKIKVLAAYGNKEKIFNEFTKETGIKVEFLDMSSGEVLARAEAEGGKPMADVWFGGGLDSFIDAKNKGLLASYKTKESEAIAPEFCDQDHYWYGVSLVTVGFMVNESLLQEKGLPAPKTWNDLLKPEYEKEILMANPAISGTNYALLSCILQARGEEQGWGYFSALAKNVPFFSKRGGEPPKKVAAGEAAIGIVPVSGEFFALSEKAPVKIYFPEDAIPWVPAGLAIFKNSENMENAQVFVDWALSKHGQEVICAADPRVMARKDVAVPVEMKDFLPEKLLKIDLERFGSERKATLDRWESLLGKQ